MTSRHEPSPLSPVEQPATTPEPAKRSRAWTLGIVSIGLFMLVLDNLVVSVALPSIRRALGPLVGGAVVQAATWHWIFWINVPIGLVLVPLAATRLDESHGAVRRMDLRGLLLGSTGLFGIVYGLVQSQTLGWTSSQIIVSLAGGAALLVAFVAYELRTPEPMLPMRFFANRSFAVTNAVSLSMYFGMFGSIFFLSQYLQN